MEIMEAGLEAIQPENVLDAGFRIQDSNLEAGNEKLDLRAFERIFLVGFGKGAGRISQIIEEKLGERLTDGWVIDVSEAKFNKISFTLGTHPLPSETNAIFTRNVLERLCELTEKDLVLVVVCGGGSALFTDPTIPVNELIEKNSELLKSGKNILEMNTERKKWDRIKGGGLAEKLQPAHIMGLIFSDVPGNDLVTIASGPTVGGSTENILMLSNLTALEAMQKKAAELGFEAEIYSDKIQGEAREVGKELIKKSKQILLAGGETTVTVHGNGQGGRNQELVLGALEDIDGYVVASIGTDGWDNSPVAGAIADSKKLDPDEYLKNNDSYHYFQKTGDFIETGRLPMNVSDLMVVLKI